VDGSKYLSKIDGLLKQNRLLGIVIVLMIIWNLSNWIMASGMQSRTQVVIMPIGLEAMQIGNGRASENYLRRMARYITTMIGTYTASTARNQFMELLDLFDPKRLILAKEMFEKIAMEIERFPSISSHINWSGHHPIRYNDKLLQVSVMKDRLVNGVITNSSPSVYCIHYEVVGTRFSILNISERDRNGRGEDENVCSGLESDVGIEVSIE